MLNYWQLAGSFSQHFEDLWRRIVDSGPRWLIAALILAVAWLLAKLVRRLVQKAIGRTSTQGHVDILVSRGVAALVLAAGVILALSELGMSLSAALAALGLASVGIGFALRDILGNLFAGILLLIQHPFTIGDQIRVGEQEGVVENIRVRDTQILTYNGERVFIPNSTVFNNPIINYTSTQSIRMDIQLRIKHVEDIDRARGLAADVLAGTPGVLDQPAPVVMVDSEDDAVVLTLRFWTDSDRNRKARLHSDIIETVVKEFGAGSIATFHQTGEEEGATHSLPDEDGTPESGDTRPMDPLPPRPGGRA